MPRNLALQIVTQFMFKQYMTQQMLFTIKIDKLRDANPA